MRVSRCGGKLFCFAKTFTKNMLTLFCSAIAGSARVPASPGRAYFTETTRLEKSVDEKGKIVLC